MYQIQISMFFYSQLNVTTSIEAANLQGCLKKESLDTKYRTMIMMMMIESCC